LLFALALGASANLEAVLEQDSECVGETCALNAVQLRGDKAEAAEGTQSEDEEAGPVHCICRDSEQKYYCAQSFAGYTKCYAPCPDACRQTGGTEFMCGGKHENVWLDRYFKGEDSSSNPALTYLSVLWLWSFRALPQNQHGGGKYEVQAGHQVSFSGARLPGCQVRIFIKCGALRVISRAASKPLEDDLGHPEP
ncbi:unnamed protein product, partial [Effrenium voratum]